MAFVKGMDLDKLEAFRASIKANPVTLGLEPYRTRRSSSCAVVRRLRKS